MNKLKHFFGLDVDRIDESRYFKANGAAILLFGIALSFADSTVGSFPIGVIIVSTGFFIFFIILMLTSLRRLRDIGRSAWWLLLFFTFVNLPFFIYLLFAKGKPSAI